MTKALTPIFALLLSGVLSACAQLPARGDLALETARPPGDDSPLDRATSAAEAQHPGQSAFRLVVEGTEAFVTRVQSARMATRSLDVQTYIWHADLTGMLFANELLRAADRGVQVRVLVDDLDARAKNASFAALSAHPNLEVRIFNPFASRSGMIGFVSEGVRSFDRINRRMHNKTWIADNRLALAGGRNIGDEYFGASDEVNFVDLDFAMIGPVVREASESFDRYWNSAAAYPIEMLDAAAVSAAQLAKLRDVLSAHAREAEQSEYAVALRSSDAIKRMLAGEWPLEWSTGFRFIADDPAKIEMRQQDAQSTQVGAALLPLARAAASELTIISPYFVPGQSGTELLVAAAQEGRNVRVLTNSLSANDVAAVHGGYSRYRKQLLQGGVELWELKPLRGSADASLFGSSGASLHTKALSIDGKTVFVGSYNIDPRSTWLNCEQGVLVEDATLAAQLDALFAAQIAPEHAWHVSLVEHDLRWSDGTEQFDSDPKASWGRRLQAWLARVLNLEAQL
jgi:putative cardiolipin synthase